MRAKHQRSVRRAGRVPTAPPVTEPEVVKAAAPDAGTADSEAVQAADAPPAVAADDVTTAASPDNDMPPADAVTTGAESVSDDLPPRRRARRRAVRPGVGGDPVIPGTSADDTDVGWHENAGAASNDERLRRDVPPHW